MDTRPLDDGDPERTDFPTLAKWIWRVAGGKWGEGVRERERERDFGIRLRQDFQKVGLFNFPQSLEK